MDHLPTLDDVVSFIKEHLKIIIITVIAGMLFYGLGIVYTIYSNNKAISQEVSQNENIDSENLILTQSELDKLQKNIVSFDFYVENEEAVQFVNYNLLKELLITPDTLKLIKDKAGLVIEPTPEYAVNVSLDHKTYLLTISIGTGSYKNNKSISNAYYSLLKDGGLPFFNNKTVYMTSPPSKNTKEITGNEGTLNGRSTGISSKKMVIFGAVAIIASVILGIIIALIYSLTRKEISDNFAYSYKEDDILLNFTNFKNTSVEKVNDKVIHAVIHPKKETKVLLSEVELDEDLTKQLQNEIKLVSKNLNEQMTTVLVAKDISDVNPLIQIDEVIIMTKKKETTKLWYKNQRILLENYDAPVKVIQI